LIQQRVLVAGGDVETSLHGSAVYQRNADTGDGTEQAAITHRDDDLAATVQGAPGRAAAAQDQALADQHPGGNAAFHHAGPGGPGIEVDEAFVHDGSAFANVGTQANPRGVGDAHAGGYHVVGHDRELVDAEHLQVIAAQARLQLALGKLL